jgi:2-dehydropantoate 2-reductase
MTELRVGVLGPGGVGGLIAGTLARNGAEVTCIASESTAATIATQGLSIESDRFGTFRQPVRAESSLSSPLDVLCVAVKATGLVQSLDRVATEMLKDAIVVPFLNGVEHVSILRERLAPARVVAATIRIESARIASGEIVQKSPFATIELAPRPGEADGVSEFAELMSQAGFDVTERDNETAILWEKLSFLAPLALLTTAYDIPAGRVRTDHRRELEDVISEAAMVAQAEGVTIDTGKVLAQFDSVPETMQSSMQRDCASGQPIEIEAIGGAIVRAALTGSLEVPTIGRLVNQLRGYSPDPA